MRKIGDMTRRRAIMVCELAGNCADAISEIVDVSSVSELAIAARWAANDCAWPALDYAGSCLEAAALLRDGWSPGDPVVRLRGGS